MQQPEFEHEDTMVESAGQMGRINSQSLVERLDSMSEIVIQALLCRLDEVEIWIFSHHEQADTLLRHDPQLGAQGIEELRPILHFLAVINPHPGVLLVLLTQDLHSV